MGRWTWRVRAVRGSVTVFAGVIRDRMSGAVRRRAARMRGRVRRRLPMIPRTIRRFRAVLVVRCDAEVRSGAGVSLAVAGVSLVVRWRVPMRGGLLSGFAGYDWRGDVRVMDHAGRRGRHDSIVACRRISAMEHRGGAQFIRRQLCTVNVMRYD